MRKSLAAICAAFVLTVVLAPIAHAATNVHVRIEGKEETLFEGVVPTTIHPIRASSDAQDRNCDGVNELDPENVVPGVTPTLASAEAMESIGETFDGQWYEGFGDYFITRFGPDVQDNAASAWWGILVNQVFTSVGGCQKQLDEDDEVLWLYDAFSSRPMLALYPGAAHYVDGVRPTRVVVAPGEPVPLEVVSFPAGGEGVSPEAPSRAGSSAYEGATVAPVAVNAKGFQRIETASPGAVVTDAAGKASVAFTTAGVHRIKATVGEPGSEHTVVRSNGLEVCVRAGFGDCGEVAATSPPETKTATAATAAPAAVPSAARISKPKLDLGNLAQGKLTISWKALDQGAGVKAWRIATKTVGEKGAFVARAHGSKGTSATLRLPRGRSYRLRFTLTDLSGHTTTYDLGKVTVPSARRG
jgi:hypothetical protein